MRYYKPYHKGIKVTRENMWGVNFSQDRIKWKVSKEHVVYGKFLGLRPWDQKQY